MRILKYPIGFVATDWGGTTIEVWSSPYLLKKCGMDGIYNPQLQQMQKYARQIYCTLMHAIIC